MTAAATAVKEITLTFNKAVADTTAAKIVVKKGNATPTFTAKWADDKKSVVLAMDSKLTKGTYDVTVSGVEKTDLIASVTVEDQKLTAFQLLSTNLVADKLPVSYGTIKFKAVDQYGNAMKTNNVTVTSSFGTTGKLNNGTFSAYSGNQIPSVKAEATAVDFDITSALAVLGTKGTLTIVGENGVNLSTEITLVEPAKAVKVECLGLYNVDKQKYMDMTAGDKIADYRIVLKFSDQYTTELKADEVTNVQATMATAMTNIKNETLAEDTTFKIDDTRVYALKFSDVDGTGKVKAGTMQVTLVNTTAGLIDTLSFEVLPGTVIKSFSVSADNDLYAGEENTLSYSAIDADGNEVTKYDVLSKAIPSGTGLPSGAQWKKQADGSAKLVYTTTIAAANVNNDTKTGYEMKPLVFSVYPAQSNIIVFNTTVRVNQARVFWEVTGIDASKVTATAGTPLEYKITDLKIADQYGNTLTADQIKDLVLNHGQTVTAKVEEGDWKVDTASSPAQTTITINSTAKIYIGNGTSDTAKISFKAPSTSKHTDDGYTLTVSKVAINKATDFAIEWKNGNTFCVSKANLTLVAGTDFEVVGKVAGKKVTIPAGSDQYQIVSGNKQNMVDPDATENKGKDRITKTATLTVVVDDADHNSNVITAEYTYSNADAKLTKLSVADKASYTVSAGADSKITLDEIIAAAFEMKDQYSKGIAADKSPSELVATITSENGKGAIIYNTTHNAYVQADNDGYWPDYITVTLTYGELTATKTIKVQ